MKKSVFPIILTFLFSSCEKELDFEYHDIPPILVIEGNLTEQGSSVRLTSTVKIDQPITNATITDAYVTLTDNSTKTSTTLFANSDGIFENAASGIVGHEYTLSVQYNQTTYESSSILLPSATINGIAFEWIKMPYDYVAVLQTSFIEPQLPSIDQYYWIRIYRNNQPYNWGITSNKAAVNGEINYSILSTRQNPDEDDDSTLVDGDCITVKVATINKAMYNYLQALMAGSNNGPQMFSGGFCLGYFIASATATAEVTFKTSEIPYAKN